MERETSMKMERKPTLPSGSSNWQLTAAIGQKVARMDHKSPWIIDPRKSWWMGWWDGLLAFALIFTALVTPYEIAFIASEETSHPLSSLFIANRVLDGLFLSDMLLQFNLMVFDEWQSRWVQTRREVAILYLKGWFLLDIGSLAPSSADYIGLFYDATAAAVNGTVDAGGGGTSSTTRIFRVIRVLRLLKLLRLLRSSRLLTRIFSRIAIPFRTFTMIKLAVIIFLTTHWVACSLGLITTFSEQQRLDTWLTAFGYCWPRAAREGEAAIEIDPSTEIVWVRPADAPAPALVPTVAECVPPGQVYNACFEWGLALITGMDIEPAAGPATPNFQRADTLTRQEITLRAAIIIIGALLWTWVTASFVEVVVNTNPDAVALRNRVEDLNRYIEDARIPAEHAQRLREYMQKTAHVSAARSRQVVLSRLSPSLRGELVLEANAPWLNNVPLFAQSATTSTGRDFLTALCSQLEASVYAPKEWLPAGFLHVVDKGMLAFRGTLLTAGKACGLDGLTYSHHLPHRQARAVTYANVSSMPALRVRELASEIDEMTHKRIRSHAVMEAMCAYLLKQLREREVIADGGAPTPAPVAIVPAVRADVASEGTNAALQQEVRSMSEGIGELKAQLAGWTVGMDELRGLRAEQRKMEARFTTRMNEMADAMLTMEVLLKRAVDHNPSSSPSTRGVQTRLASNGEPPIGLGFHDA